ncbi:MAG: DUF4340 domain-containing protein [Phycisphaerales bacterium]
MSKAATVVLLVIALGLGATLFLINRGASPAPNGPSDAQTTTGPAFEIDPAQVRAMTVTEPGGVTRSVYRTDLGGWIYAELPVSATPDVGWPTDATQVNSALRTLSLIPVAGDAESASISDTAPIIELRMADGSTRSLQVERDSVGGNTLARVDEERLVLIEASSVSGVLESGPEAWRVNSPLAGIAADASRITIVAGEQRVALAKVDNRWIMRGPISARADEAVIRTVLEAILKMRITQFAGEDSLVTDPIVTIEVERDDLVRDDGSARRVTSRTLAIGGQADAGGSTRRATVRGTDLPSATSLVVERGSIITDQQFANLARAEAYLSKTAVPERREDIGIILFRPLGDPTSDRGFRRDLEGWNEMRPDGGMRTAELPDREALTAAITMLTGTPGEARIAANIEGFRPLTRVEMYTLDDSDLGSLQAGYVDGTLAVRRGNVLWLYPEVQAPALFQLPSPDQLEPEPEREPSDASDSDTGDNK